MRSEPLGLFWLGIYAGDDGLWRVYFRSPCSVHGYHNRPYPFEPGYQFQSEAARRCDELARMLLACNPWLEEVGHPN